MGDSKFELIVNDRRGQKKPVCSEPVAEPVTPEAIDRSSWKSVVFVIAMMPDQNGGVVCMGQGVGVRSDDHLFKAPWIFPPLWREGQDWTAECRKRLDTFLNCDCGAMGTCSAHRHYLELAWPRADQERLESYQGTAEVPLAFERLVLQQRAMATRPRVPPGVLR